MYNLLDVCAGFIRLINFFLQIILFPLCYLLYFILLQPIKLVSSTTFWKIENYLYEACIFVVSSWNDLAGHEVVETGEDISSIIDEKTLIIANHQCPSDIGILMRVFQNRNGFFRRNMWVMDWIFQFVFFGWVSKGHGDFFILQPNDAKNFSKLLGKHAEEKCKNSIKLLTEQLKRNFFERDYKSIIVFPEGGFLNNRKIGSDRYASKIGHPILKYVALPRVGAFHAILNSSCGFKWIIDVTIAYPKPISIIQHLFRFTAQKRKLFVHLRAFKVSELQKVGECYDDEQVKEWLFARFREKEEILCKFYKTGELSSEIRNHKTLSFTRYLLIHLGLFFTIYIIVMFFVTNIFT